MTIRVLWKSSKIKYYDIIDDQSNVIVRFDDLKTAAVVLRYMQGADLSEYERIIALAALTEKTERKEG